MNIKKKMIAALLGFTFLIAGFGVSYDFDYGTFQVKSNEVKAKEDEWPRFNGKRNSYGICRWSIRDRVCVVH